MVCVVLAANTFGIVEGLVVLVNASSDRILRISCLFGLDLNATGLFVRLRRHGIVSLSSASRRIDV